MKTTSFRKGFLLAIPSVAMLASCSDDTLRNEVASGERQLVELRHRLELLEYRAEQIDTGAFDELRVVEGKLRRMSELTTELLAKQKALTEETALLGEQFAETKASVFHETRERMIGRQWEKMTVRNGETFEKVRVVSVDDGGVSIRHEHGTARLGYDDLTVAQQVEFGMDAELAAAADEKERKEAVAYHKWIDSEIALQARETERRSDLAEESAARTSLTRSSLADSAFDRSGLGDSLASTRTSPLSKPAQTFGTGSIYRRYYQRNYGTSYRSYAPTYRSTYYYRSYCPSDRSSREIVHPRISRPEGVYSAP